jgi:hypothetical protein
VRWIVVGCRTCLEYEDAQVGVGCRKTACDDAASSATYRCTCSSSEERGEREDDAPPAMIISYSSLIVMGVDIVACVLQG